MALFRRVRAATRHMATLRTRAAFGRPDEPGAQVALDLKDLTAPRVDQLFEITLEPASGSPTGRPTGPVLFKGTTSQAL